MFLKYIGTTPLTNNDADAFFEGKIFGDNIYGDTTFVASMRAMLADRLDEGETLRFFFNTNYIVIFIKFLIFKKASGSFRL